jgi:gamma-glutamyl phosphate reductase
MRTCRTFILAGVLAVAGVAVSSSAPTLVEAVRAGNRDAVRALLRSKTDVNAAEPDGTTALHYAVQADAVVTTKLLLKAGGACGRR